MQNRLCVVVVKGMIMQRFVLEVYAASLCSVFCVLSRGPFGYSFMKENIKQLCEYMIRIKEKYKMFRQKQPCKYTIFDHEREAQQMIWLYRKVLEISFLVSPSLALFC